MRAAQRIVKRLLAKYSGSHEPPFDRIGRYRIRLPLNSPILEYKRQFPLYDTALADIANVVRSKYPDLHAIDIGANVGDTAALIRKDADIPVLCIEGDPLVLPILAENAGRIGGIIIESSFVGPDGITVNPEEADDVGRNACLAGAIRETGPLVLRSLRTILNDHPGFCNAKLLKSDTEGFDFTILRQSRDFLRQAKPVLFFEYDPHFSPAEPKAGLETLDFLIENGYSDFLYYDNFGNFLLHANAAQRNILVNLDDYLASNRDHGIVVYYFDICAFHRDDADLAAAVSQRKPATP